jgi:predicted AlkP superfamily phosphohydrolase/phosphomutase
MQVDGTRNSEESNRGIYLTFGVFTTRFPNDIRILHLLSTRIENEYLFNAHYFCNVFILASTNRIVPFFMWFLMTGTHGEIHGKDSNGDMYLE